jgi:hypothetical protein
LIASGAIIILVFAKISTLWQRIWAAFAVETSIVKIEITDPENFAGTLFMTSFTICFAQEFERRFEGT